MGLEWDGNRGEGYLRVPLDLLGSGMIEIHESAALLQLLVRLLSPVDIDLRLRTFLGESALQLLRGENRGLLYLERRVSLLLGE